MQSWIKYAFQLILGVHKTDLKLICYGIYALLIALNHSLTTDGVLGKLLPRGRLEARGFFDILSSPCS